MASGLEMMMKALKSMVPEHVWELVEKNVIALGGEVTTIKTRLEDIEKHQREIKELLNTQFGPLARKPFPGEEATHATECSQANGAQ